MATILPRRPAAVSLNEKRNGCAMAARTVRTFVKNVLPNAAAVRQPPAAGRGYSIDRSLSCHPRRRTDLGFTRDRRLTRPSRLKPTWVGRSGTQLSTHACIGRWVPALASLGRDDTDKERCCYAAPRRRF